MPKTCFATTKTRNWNASGLSALKNSLGSAETADLKIKL